MLTSKDINMMSSVNITTWVVVNIIVWLVVNNSGNTVSGKYDIVSGKYNYMMSIKCDAILSGKY
jgi:hypothetical protein